MAIESVNPVVELDPNEALDRLCNAECMLQLVIKGIDDTNLSPETWAVSEALHGIRRLLDGCYISLAELVNSRQSPVSPAEQEC